MKINKLGLVKYLIILGIVLWSLPTLADEIPVEPPTSTPETEATSTPPVIPEPTPTPSSNVIIRYQDQIVWSGNINLSSAVYHDAINELDYTLTTPTVFSALVLADQQSDTFTISNAQFSYSVWPNGFYVRCLSIIIANLADNKCDNWQYTVNGEYLGVGMDHKPLVGSENIYIYFGDRYNLTTDTTTVTIGEVLTTTLKEYSYQTNDWVLANNQLTLATEVIKSDYSNWPPTTIAQATTTDGLALFNFSATGTYYITLPDSYWPGVTISVTSTATSTPPTTSTDPQPPTGGGSGSGTNNQFVSQERINDTVEKLLAFIKSKQESDGKIVDGGTSDWLAMSFGARNIYSNTVKNGNTSLYDYTYNYPTTELDSELNNCAAHPRHILALLASGVGNTDTTVTTLKSKLNTCVTNNTFGANGINDDIFGLLAAVALQENNNSPVVQTTIAAIIANQQPSGAFAYPGPFESPDLTGAAVNALKYAQNNGVAVAAEVFAKAKAYLKAHQLADGGWGFGTSDALTTGWAMMGINALGEGQNDWFNSAGKNPWHILTTLDNDHFTQSWDGNVDWFGTKHAIPALLGKSWPILNNTQNQANSGSVGGSNPITSTTPENTSIIAATSTPTTTALAIVPETPTEPENIILVGEVLGEQIVNELAKPTAIKKRTVVAQNTTAPLTQTVVSEPEAQSASMPAESATPDDVTFFENSNSHLLAKTMLLVSSGGAVLIGLYLGIKNLKKK